MGISSFVIPTAVLAQAPVAPTPATPPAPEPPPEPIHVPPLPESVTDPSAVPPYLVILVASAIALVVLIGIALTLFFVVRARLRRPPPPVPQQHPLVEALGRLRDLTSRIETTDADDVAREVSEALKRFTDRRFRVHFQKRTTEEIAAEKGSWRQQLPEDLGTAIVPFLQRCDMIKFMGSSEIETEKKQIIDEATILIEQAHEAAQAAEQREARRKKAAA